jgi:glycosyl hydrolase family 3
MREPKLAVPLLLVSTIHPSAQVPLLDFSIIGINKNMIVVITAGGNVDMPTWIDQVPAVLHAWYPGQEGGTALAQIVFGEFSSSGKLPAGFERRWEDNATVDNYYPAITRNRWSTKKASLWGYRHFDRPRADTDFSPRIWWSGQPGNGFIRCEKC